MSVEELRTDFKRITYSPTEITSDSETKDHFVFHVPIKLHPCSSSATDPAPSAYPPSSGPPNVWRDTFYAGRESLGCR